MGKNYTILERLARSKHSSLLRKFANYGGKKVYNIAHQGNGRDDKERSGKVFPGPRKGRVVDG
jgi:hypothetical protein